MRRWDGLVDKYLAVQFTKGLEQATVETRRRELTRLGGWLKGRRPKPVLDEVGADLLVRYVSSRTPFHSRSTVAGVVSILRSIGEFLVEEGVWGSNPLRWMRGPKIDQRRRLPRRIDREQLQALWRAAEARRQEHARYQAVCALAIMYGTGLRRGELERLDLADWDRDNSVLKIDGRKTGRERQVPVGEGVWRCIEGYLPHRHNRLEAKGRVSEQALLVSSRGERLSGSLISVLISRLARSAGIAHVTPHQFRHSCASDLLEAGVTIPEVQRILGHSAIASTVRYTAVADPERAKAMSKHPLNRFLGEPPGEEGLVTRVEMDPWLEGYLAYQRDVRRMSPRTIIDLRCTLKKVSGVMEEARPGTPLWKLTLEDFLAWLNEARERGQSEKALAKELSHIRGLLDYAWRSGRASRNVLDGFSLQDNLKRTEPRTLTLEEAERLVHACPRQTAAQRRTRVVVLLLYGCGLRTAELCGLDVQDVNVERQEVFIRRGKGDRQRTIPVPAAVWTELLAYLIEEGHKRGPLLRTQAKRARISQADVGEIVKAAAERASVDGRVTPRTLRHTFGTHLMDAGVDLVVIASLMGHRSPAETGIYLHVLPGKPRQAVTTLLKDEEEAP